MSCSRWIRPSVLHTQVMNLRDDVRRILREEKVAIAGGIGQQARGVQLRVADADDRAKILPKLRGLAQSFETPRRRRGAARHRGCRRRPHSHHASPTPASPTRCARGVEQSIEVVRRRVDALGTKEPSIQREGDDRVARSGAGPAGPGATEGNPRPDGEARIPPRRRARPEPGGCRGTRTRSSRAASSTVEKQVMVQGEDLTDAQPGFDSAAQRRAGRQLPLQHSRRAEIRRGDLEERRTPLRHRARQQGHFGAAHPHADHRRLGPDFRPFHRRAGQQPGDPAARRRAARQAQHRRGAHRRSGPRPGLRSTPASARPMSAPRLVVVYMLITYGVFGVFANLALFVHIAFIFAGLVLLGSTLTLPGIAGIVLTIGMAVDSNVLIYERIREEQHVGPLDPRLARRRLQPRLRDHRRLQRHHVRRGGDPLLPGLRPGARLRRVAGARHSDDASSPPSP